jgi:hypothetical protein
VPPSANAHELFRGFSFIAPCLLEEQTNNQPTERQTDPLAKVSFSHIHMLVLLYRSMHNISLLSRITFCVREICEMSVDGVESIFLL